MPEHDLSFREVPPPDAAPTHPEAARFGVLSCLRVESDQGMFRCGGCGQMQPHGSPLVWVPRSVRIGDPAWSIRETSRLTAVNGHRSGWCVPCARELGQDEPAAEGSQTPRPWWSRLFNRH